LIFAPTPVGINFFVLPASATLLDVKVIALIVLVDRALAAIAPDNGLMRPINFDPQWHGDLAG
jgi:hypothetical protein